MSEKAPQHLVEYSTILQRLAARWQPHPGQVPIGQALFWNQRKRLFLQLGRRYGKSEFLSYALIRTALTTPNAACYYVAPFFRQAREILWTNGRIQQMVPPEYLADVNNTELRIRFTNGSFIKLTGADDPDSLRGIRTNMIVLDEYAQMREELLETVLPSLADFKAPLIVSGTPPPVRNHFVDLANEARVSDKWNFFKGGTHENPYIDRDWLVEQERRLTARGEYDVWKREYLADFIASGRSSIFPMLNREKHVMPYDQMVNIVRRRQNKMTFIVGADPGTASVFAVVLIAIDEYTRDVYVLDEIYLTDQHDISVGRLWPKVQAKMEEAIPADMMDDDWMRTHDSASTWFSAELIDQFGVNSMPVAKNRVKRFDGIGQLKDIMLAGRFHMSDRCVNMYREMEEYALAPNGLPVKKNDHSIDAARYALNTANYTFVDSPDPQQIDIPEDERRRYVRIEDEWENRRPGEVPTYLLDED